MDEKSREKRNIKAVERLATLREARARLATAIAEISLDNTEDTPSVSKNVKKEIIPPITTDPVLGAPPPIPSFTVQALVSPRSLTNYTNTVPKNDTDWEGKTKSAPIKQLTTLLEEKEKKEKKKEEKKEKEKDGEKEEKEVQDGTKSQNKNSSSVSLVRVRSVRKVLTSGRKSWGWGDLEKKLRLSPRKREQINKDKINKNNNHHPDINNNISLDSPPNPVSDGEEEEEEEEEEEQKEQKEQQQKEEYVLIIDEDKGKERSSIEVIEEKKEVGKKATDIVIMEKESDISLYDTPKLSNMYDDMGTSSYITIGTSNNVKEQIEIEEDTLNNTLSNEKLVSSKGKYKRIDVEQLPQTPEVSSNEEFRRKFVMSKKKIGKGAFSKVLLGANRETGEPVAIKIVSIDNLRRSDHAAREYKNLIREVVICQMCEHPNVVTTYGIYMSGSSFLESEEIYFVMEYMKGGTLWRRAVQRNSCDEVQARTLVHRILRGLRYLHSIGITHRDIKLSNVMIKSKKMWWDVRISDFGLSSIALAQGQKTMRAKCGTPSYMAPEVFIGHAYTSQVDLWSLGVTVYALMLGELPFQGETRRDMWKQARNGKIIYPYGCKLSPQAKDFIRGLLTPNPDDRLSIEQAMNHRWIQSSPSLAGSEAFQGILNGKYLTHREKGKGKEIPTEMRESCSLGRECTETDPQHYIQYDHTGLVLLNRPKKGENITAITETLEFEVKVTGGVVSGVRRIKEEDTIRIPVMKEHENISIIKTPSNISPSSSSLIPNREYKPILRPKSKLISSRTLFTDSEKPQVVAETIATIKGISMSKYTEKQIKIHNGVEKEEEEKEEEEEEEEEDDDDEWEIFAQEDIEADGIELLTEEGIAFKREDLLSYEAEDDGIEEEALDALPREEPLRGIEMV